MRARLLGLLCVGLCSSSCIVEAPGGAPKGASGSGLAAVRQPVPPATVRSGAILGGKVEVVGAKFDPGRAYPGDTVAVTAFFKVLEKLDRDYLVFVHVEDVDGKLARVNADHPPAGGSYPTSEWKVGETVSDTFQVYAPPGSPIRGLNLWMGLWHAPTDSRLPLANPEAVRNDGTNRILLATIPVGAP